MPDTFDPRELMASAYICSTSTDQLMLGLAGHSPVLGVFVTQYGEAIAYHPTNPKGVWQPIPATMGWSEAAMVPNLMGR